MSKSIEQQIAVLDKKIPEWEVRLQKVKKWALDDGDLSPNDQAAIEKSKRQSPNSGRKGSS
jgi:hypothetical protein